MSLLPSEFGSKPTFTKTDVACFSDDGDFWKRSTMEEFVNRILGGTIQSNGAATILNGSLKVLTTSEFVGNITKKGATKDMVIADAGTVSATEDGWIEVHIGGAPHYIRTHFNK